MKIVNILGKIVLVSLFPLGLITLWVTIFLLVILFFNTIDLIPIKLPDELILLLYPIIPIVITFSIQTLLYAAIKKGKPNSLPKHIAWFPILGIIIGLITLLIIYQVWGLFYILGPLPIYIGAGLDDHSHPPPPLELFSPLYPPLIASILIGTLIVLIGGKRYNIIKKDITQQPAAA